MKELEERQKRYAKMLVLVHNLERHYSSMTRVPDNNAELKKLRKLANLKAYEDKADKVNKDQFRYRVDNWDGLSIHFVCLYDINHALFHSPGRISFKDIRKKLMKKGACLSVDDTNSLKTGTFYVKKGSTTIKQVLPVGKVVA